MIILALLATAARQDTMTLTPPHRKDQRNRQRRRRGDGDALVARVRSIATLSAFPCSYHAASTTRPIDGIFYISAQKRALPTSKTVTTQAAVKSGPTTRWSFHTCYPNEYYYSFCSHTTRSLPSLPITYIHAATASIIVVVIRIYFQRCHLGSYLSSSTG
jgi:hypothetical protein